MRISKRHIPALCLLVAACLMAVPRGMAQGSESMMPDASARKANQLLQATIEALGGSKYLNVRDVTCKGRLSQFGHSGELNGFETFVDYTVPPSKDRTENLPKRNIITVFNGDKGWVLDRGGVSVAPQTDLAQFKADIQNDLDNVLRHRIHEPGMILSYGGSDVVDLKEADWVELVDNENRTIRIAIARSTRLPIRKVVETHDPNTQMKSEEIEYYSLYQNIDGIETPYQITRDRNGVKVYQVFFDKCEYNTNIPDTFFTKESLDERWAHVGNKYKEKKDKRNKNDKDKESNEDH